MNDSDAKDHSQHVYPPAIDMNRRGTAPPLTPLLAMLIASRSPRHPVVGQLRPWTCQALGTDGEWYEFATEGGIVEGLCKVHGDPYNDGETVEILAVATAPSHWGRGYCGRFLRDLTTSYACVRVWQVDNPVLADMLARRGFTRTTSPLDGSDGWEWNRP